MLKGVVTSNDIYVDEDTGSLVIKKSEIEKVVEPQEIKKTKLKKKEKKLVRERMFGWDYVIRLAEVSPKMTLY